MPHQSVTASITFEVRQLIEFYDHEDKEGNARHASAITGVLGESLGIGLLQHYLREQGFTTSVADTTPKTTVPQTNCRNRRRWLDFWLFAVKGSERHLYQVEVKNWSVHSLGGSELSVDADPDAVADYARHRWRELVAADGSIRPANLAKVLLTGYELPPDWPGQPTPAATPLACLWTVLHPEGDPLPSFTCDMRRPDAVAADEAVSCRFFSMSAYLRQLLRANHEKIDLELPLLKARLALIGQLLSTAMPPPPAHA
jgi:hypothetical protein